MDGLRKIILTFVHLSKNIINNCPLNTAEKLASLSNPVQDFSKNFRVFLGNCSFQLG